MLKTKSTFFTPLLLLMITACSTPYLPKTEPLVTPVSNSPLNSSGILVVGEKPGHFDFMDVDDMNEKILATHPAQQELVIYDSKKSISKSVGSVGHVQGLAVDSKSKSYILGAADEHKIVFLNSDTLAIRGTLNVSGPVDAIAFDPKNGLAYAGEDDGSQLWVVNVKSRKLVTTIKLSGVPEVIQYARSTDRLYQNLKTKNVVAVINPKSNKVESEWSTLPAEGPHGLAIDESSGLLFSAGHNGKLVAIDLKSGKTTWQVDIAPGTDQIAYDPGTKRIYCASMGFISVVQESGDGLKNIGDVPSHAGTHTLAVSSKDHVVWGSFTNATKSYLERFVPGDL